MSRGAMWASRGLNWPKWPADRASPCPRVLQACAMKCVQTPANSATRARDGAGAGSQLCLPISSNLHRVGGQRLGPPLHVMLNARPSPLLWEELPPHRQTYARTLPPPSGQPTSFASHQFRKLRLTGSLAGCRTGDHFVLFTLCD